MFGAIIITFVITFLLMTVAFLVNFGQQKEKENRQLQRENGSLHKQVDNLYAREQSKRVRTAYNRGLHDGRETDTLYRRMLAQYSKGEQATVMMYGERQQEEQR